MARDRAHVVAVPLHGHVHPMLGLGPRVVELFAEEREAALEPLAGAYETVGRPQAVVYDQVSGFAPVLAAPWGVPAG